MKKSKEIKLVLITSLLASCSTQEKEWTGGSKTYVRSDTTAPYARAHGSGSGLWFYAFRPYGLWSNGLYQRQGFYSRAIPESANVGNNMTKSGIARGGFGGSGVRASS